MANKPLYTVYKRYIQLNDRRLAFLYRLNFSLECNYFRINGYTHFSSAALALMTNGLWTQSLLLCNRIGHSDSCHYEKILRFESIYLIKIKKKKREVERIGQCGGFFFIEVLLNSFTDVYGFVASSRSKSVTAFPSLLWWMVFFRISSPICNFDL